MVVTGGQDARIRCARWFTCNGQGPEADFLTVEVSTDGGATWQVAEVVSSAGPQWIVQEFDLSEVAEPGETVRLRFSTADRPNNSLAEAGVDEVSVTVLKCADDTEGPQIVHDGGAGTRPFSGYIDPRRESADGMHLDQGIDAITLAFSE